MKGEESLGAEHLPPQGAWEEMLQAALGSQDITSPALVPIRMMQSLTIHHRHRAPSPHRDGSAGLAPLCHCAFFYWKTPNQLMYSSTAHLYLGNGHRPHPAAYMLACATQLILSAARTLSQLLLSLLCTRSQRRWPQPALPGG